MDVQAIFTLLDRYGVKYILTGALAAIAHGARLRTNDVDICISTDAENLRKTAAMLSAAHARLIREPIGRDTASINCNDWKSLRLDDPSEHHLFSTLFGRIDVLPEPFGTGGRGSTTNYAELKPRAVEVEAFGMTIPVAAFDYIAASKIATGREQDVAAQAELLRVGELIARGEPADYGLEQYAGETTSAQQEPGHKDRALQGDRPNHHGLQAIAGSDAEQHDGSKHSR